MSKSNPTDQDQSGAFELAQRLLLTAAEDPASVLQSGQDLLLGLAAENHKAKSVVFRAMALAARTTDGADRSITYAEESLTEALDSGDETLAVDSLMTLAGSSALQGSNDRAIELLEDAQSKAHGLKAAQVRFQLGSVMARMGRTVDASRLFNTAIPEFRAHNDRWFLAMSLHNLGMINLQKGAIDAALHSFDEAAELESELKLEAPLAALEHNIGVALAMKGDLPRALLALDSSETKYREIAGSPVEVQVSRVNVLMTAGLFREARVLAAKIAPELDKQGLREDSAEAVLAEAVAALHTDDPEAARQLAKSAAASFHAQSRETWADNAELVRLTANLEDHELSESDLDQARELADRLSAQGQEQEATRARLTAGLIGIELQSTSAADDLRVVAEAPAMTAQQEVHKALAKALIQRLHGKPRKALQTCHSGLRVLTEHQAALGATDIRAGIERHARRLHDLGTELVFEVGTVAEALDWVEQTKARSLLFKPVIPPGDEKLAADLASLRQVEVALRDSPTDQLGELRAQEVRLQQAIRDRNRHAESRSSLPTSQAISAVILNSGTTLLELTEFDGRTWAFTCHNGEIHLKPVGMTDAIRRDLRGLRFNLRLLARGRGRIDRTRQLAERIDELLLSSLPKGIDHVVIVPSAPLFGVPWSILPSLGETPITVSPSAELWLRASSGTQQWDLRPVAIAGPNLASADREVQMVASLFDSATLLDSATSRVQTVLRETNGASLAHFACHAFFRHENPMLSSLQLADGDLHVYDIERLEDPPDLVVLSACDSGFTETHPGDELMGLSSALISIGTRNVIASVGLVPDSDATADLMNALYRGILGGSHPAAALRRAQTSVGQGTEGLVAAANFVCIGGN